MRTTVIIPISGNTDHIRNVIKIQENCIVHSDSIIIRIIFDEKKSEKSLLNYNYLMENSHPNCEITKNSFTSVGDVRNAGMSHIKTKWFSFCDADDQIIPEMYLRMIDEAEISGANLAIGGYIETIANSDVKSIIPIDNKFNWQDFGRNPGIWRYLFRAKNFSELRFPSLSMAEDQIFLSQVYAENPIVKICALPVYRYSLNSEGSLTSNRKEVENIVKVLETSKSIRNSDNSKFRKLQNAFKIAQLLTAFKNDRTSKKFSYIYRLIKIVAFGNFLDMTASIKFLLLYLGRR